MTENITITLEDGLNLKIPAGTTVRSLWEGLQNQPADIDPVGAVLNKGTLCWMQDALVTDGDISWIDRKSEEGYHIYRQSVLLMLLKASHELFPQHRFIVHHTISNGVYCEFEGHRLLPEDCEQLSRKMQELVTADQPIQLLEITGEEAAVLFEKQGHPESAELMRIYPEETVRLVELDGYVEYFFYSTVDHTGMLQEFRLFAYENGLVLQTPEQGAAAVSEFNEQKKLQYILSEAAEWIDMMQVNHVADLNRKTKAGELNSIIQVSEALHEKHIARIADEVCCDPRVRLIMIAGPSSSGKTSFAQRLSIQLRVNGRKPMAISMDNYFIDREKTPKDENGQYDFENLDALQVELFNQHLVQILNGERVQMPMYDFIQGKSIKEGPWIQLEEGQPLIIEGIHGLNDRLTFSVPRENKRLIYISALTQLNLNYSNAIFTSDSRLLRRIARDNRTRGHNVQQTIERWPSVRRGEKKNIFVYQENADLFLNSQLVYELAALKPIVEPLLQSVPKEDPAHVEAQRLLRFLHYVIPVQDPKVPYQSLMREFIGGSWFEVE